MLKPFTKETIDTIIKIGGKGTLKHIKCITLRIQKKNKTD